MENKVVGLKTSVSTSSEAVSLSAEPSDPAASGEDSDGVTSVTTAPMQVRAALRKPSKQVQLYSSLGLTVQCKTAFIWYLALNVVYSTSANVAQENTVIDN